MKTKLVRVLPSANCLARLFSQQVVDSLSTAELAEAVRRNSADATPGVCHTHDFCDANMLMHEAFVKCGLVMDNGEDVVEDALIPLWNAAWELAAKANFQAESLLPFTAEEEEMLGMH